jgi:hypothetical protein
MRCYFVVLWWLSLFVCHSSRCVATTDDFVVAYCKAVEQRMNAERKRLFDDGLRELPAIDLPSADRNGEALDTDEAAVWKRVLNYRLASHLKPRRLIETHPGVGVSTTLYKHASPGTEFIPVSDAISMRGPSISMIDIDPFGSPWLSLEEVSCLISRETVIQVSNGEAHAVRRNLKRGQKYPTRYFGCRLPQWVIKEYLPHLENTVGLKVQFFYVFPTTVRVILANRPLPQHLWLGCPRWMWWLSKYG